MLQIAKDLKSFEIINDIQHLRENNDYRYIRHAALSDNNIAFCCEIGKDSNKLVVIKVHEDSTCDIILEQSG